MKITEHRKRVQSRGPESDGEKRNLESILSYDIKLFPFRFDDQAKEAFYLELSTLFAAGLDIKSSLEIVIGEREKKEEVVLLQGVLSELIKGQSFSESLMISKQFSPYEYYSIQIGEETGKLNTVLVKLAGFYSNKLKQRRKIISTLSYPVIILITAISAVAFMLTFVVPMFKDIFSRFGGELPGLTKIIISFSETVQSYFFPIFFLLLVIAGIMVYLYRFERFRRSVSASLVKIPLIGRLIVTVYLERFCSSMSLLVGAKIPLLTAIDLIGKMIPFYPIQDALAEISKRVMLGENLYVSMSRFSIFDRKMLALIKVGEEVNKLDFFFEQLTQRFNQEIEYRTSLLGTFLEPAIIIFLGVVVAFILIAMYLPMFQMSNQIGI